MIWEALRFDSFFKKAVIISLGGHMLFLFSVCLTFNSYSAASQEMGVYFLGSLLAKADLSLLARDKNNYYPLKFKTVAPQKSIKKESANLSYFSRKPSYPASAVTASVKHLDKFVVAERRQSIQPVARQKIFEPPAWEDIKLRTKAE